MSFHIFRSLMSDMVALCTPYSVAKSLPCAPLASLRRIARTVSAVSTAPGFKFRAAFNSSKVGHP